MGFVIRSIDVGYGNTKYVADVENRRTVCRHFPSVAPLADARHMTEAMGKRRKTVQIAIDELTYEVGPEAGLAQGSVVVRNMADDYCTTPEYLALVRGALHYMGLEQIDLLMLGLPLSTLVMHGDALEKRLAGEHRTGGGRRTHVQRVKVLAQPQGALMAYGGRVGRPAALQRQKHLILDCGARTFDWLVAYGMKVQDKRSGAVNRGMLDVLGTIAAGVSGAVGANFRNLEAIDLALRTGAPATAFGKPVDLGPFLPAARKIAAEAVTAMKSSIGDVDDIDNVIVTGGGAFFFTPLIRQGLPTYRSCRTHRRGVPSARPLRRAGPRRVRRKRVRSRLSRRTQCSPRRTDGPSPRRRRLMGGRWWACTLMSDA